jgi:dipeptidyl-peptidase-4
MSKYLLFLVCAAFIVTGSTVATAQNLTIPEALFSRAEKTNYAETSLNADVVAFCETLDRASDLATMKKFGTSGDGNDLLMVIIARPAVSTPEEAAATGKPVIYIQGNIHAGEVEGKEASLRLMREICFGPRQDLIENQILVFCPNYNPDGNDKLSATSRPSQDGSPLMAGIRTSGEGFDLNREGIKAEAREMKALLSEIIVKWDPVLLIDLHTDNGSWHGYALNYAAPYLSAGMPQITSYVEDSILAPVTSKILERSGLPFFYYGNMRSRPGDPVTFSTYSHLPRYIVNYMGLRNRRANLRETFAHARFEKRTLSTYLFLVSILEHTSENGAEMVKLTKEAEEETIKLISESGGTLTRGVSFTMAASPEKINLLTRETESYTDANGRTRSRATGRLHWISDVTHMNHFEPRVVAPVPFGYYFPAELGSVADKLKEHGIQVSNISRREKIEADLFTVSKFSRSARPSYGDHYTVTVDGSFSRKTVNVPAGSYFVDMRQPLAWLVFYMLEPQSDDGLLLWNYFDNYLMGKGAETKPVEYPVYKLMRPIK